jgi:hypothetical protein
MSDKIFDQLLESKKSTKPAGENTGPEPKTGASTQPPVFQLKGGEKDSSTPTKTEEKLAVVDIIKNEYNTALKANKGKKELAFDRLAKFIASQTKARRFSRKGGGTKYGFAPGSLKISGDKEAMEFLHNIGYWKDKPRRIQKAAMELYDKFSAEKDSDGNRTKALDEEDAKSEITDIVGVIRPDKEQRKTEQEALNKEQKDNKVKKDNKLTIAGGPDNIAKNAVNDKYAWSASTISKIQHMAGSGDTFAYGEGHIHYARESKKNIKKDNIEGLEKLHPAFGKEKKGVGIGDTLHKSRIKKSTYKKIYKKTHSDVVVAIEVYIRGAVDKKKGRKKSKKKGPLKKVGTYQEMINNFTTEKKDRPELTLKEYVKENGYKIYAVVIGGNTSDYSAPDKRIAKKDTVGKNFIPLNYDKTISKSKSKGKKAYFGVQKTDF